MQSTMKAVVTTVYGSPDVLRLVEVAKPAPQDNEVLVKIHATTVTAAHTMMRQGVPRIGRLFIGLTKPRNTISGTEFAGEVVAVGRGVMRFQVGDQIFGATDVDGGCYAEYICLAEDAVMAHKPANVTYGEAATLLDGSMTSMHFLCNIAEIRPGQRVLINGASGSVGSAAVQIAKHFGAHVTGVCSSVNVELVKSLGADEVIDYTNEDFTKATERYDIIFDTVGKSSFARSKHALKPSGVYMTTVAGLAAMSDALRTALTSDKKAKFGAAGLRAADAKRKDLALLIELIETGRIRPVVDRSYPLEEIAEAHRYVETGRKRGNVAIDVVQGDGLQQDIDAVLAQVV